MGRPISYDLEKTLDLIQDQFWTGGYCGTSMDDIMRSTGLGKGSLYGAYGSKHDMYVLALTDYCDWIGDDYARKLRGPDAEAFHRLTRFIRGATKPATGSDRGCMLAKATAELTGQFSDVDALIKRGYAVMEREIASCVRQAQKAGAIDASRDAKTIGISLLAMVRGVEALRKAGMPSSSLLQIAKGARELLGATPR